VWAFIPALKTDFQYFDENAIIISNSHVNSGLSWQNLRWALFSTDYSYSYPLSRISHMLDIQMYGRNAWGPHLTNVLLHATNAVLLFLVLKRMTGALWRSLIVAAFFALHPLRVESVVWISERKDVLSTFFGFLTLWTYARFTEETKAQGGRPKVFYGLTLLFFTMSLMSKAMLVTLPCLMLLLDYWPLKRITNDELRIAKVKTLLLEKIPFFLLVVPVSLATYFATKAGGVFVLNPTLGSRLETALTSYARYLGKMFWPADFSVLYPYQNHWPANQWLGAGALILVISVAAFLLWRQRPYLMVGWLWYLGTLVPVISLRPLGGQSITNHFTYVPMIGIVLALVWGIEELTKQWRRRNIILASLVLLLLGACAWRTRAEIVYWKDGKTLWTRAVAVTKDNFLAHYCLANILLKSDLQKALVEFQKSVAIYPDYFEAQYGLAVNLMVANRYPEAVGPLEKAMRLDPQSSWAYHDLGISFFKTGRASDAVPLLMKAVRMDPQNAHYADDLGIVLFPNGQKTDAVSNFLATARSDPAGFGHFLDAAQFDTNHVGLINNMAWCFATDPDPNLRNGKYAVRLATRACEMTRFQNTIFVGTLALAYAEDSRFDDAISTTQLACSLASKTSQTDLLIKAQALLALFRSHQPYHEPAKGISP
jgi:protein O-mannosyl-transferase